MATRNVFKNFNVFIEGRGYAGQVEELTPPKLTLLTEEFRGGGMDASIALEMGMEALQASGSFIAWDIDLLKQWGKRGLNATRLTIRGALGEPDGSITPVVITLAGRFKTQDLGTLKAGDKAPVRFEMDCTYYRMEHGVNIVHEIDVENMVRVIDGVDVLAEKRAALGLI